MKFILTPEVIIPFIISNAAATWILWLAIRKPNVAEGLLAIVFLGAGSFNIYNAFANPDSYLAFADTTFLPFYKDFIQGIFAKNIQFIISMIGGGQLFIGLSVLLENPRFRFACITGFIFSLAIAPLGIGSAFPASLILGASFLILLVKRETSTT